MVEAEAQVGRVGSRKKLTASRHPKVVEAEAQAGRGRSGKIFTASRHPKVVEAEVPHPPSLLTNFVQMLSSMDRGLVPHDKALSFQHPSHC